MSYKLASLLLGGAMMAQDPQWILVSHAAKYSQITGRDITYASIQPPPPYETVAVGSLVIGDGAWAAPSTTFARLWLRSSDGTERRLEPAGLVNGRAIRYRIPESTPLGLAAVRDESGSTQTIMIAARRFELFPDGVRSGGDPITVARPALAGQRVTLDGTGLGTSPQEAKVAVHLGRLTVRPSVTSVAGQPGLDRLEFIVPPGVPLACRLAVTVEADGDYTTLPFRQLATAVTGSVCPEATGISQEDLDASEAQRCVPAISASVSTIANQVSGPSRSHLYASASFHPLFVPSPLWSVETPVGTCRGQVLQPGAYLSFAMSPGSPLDERPSCALPTGDLQLRDDQNRVVANEAAQANSWDQMPDAPFGSGIWRLRWGNQEWPLPVILLRWLNSADADSLARDREYVVRWDTSHTRPGDRVELTISGSDRLRGYWLRCAAEAAQGTIVLPPGALWQMPEELSGQPGGVGLLLLRPTEIRRLTSGPARYLIFSNSSQEFRPITLP